MKEGRKTKKYDQNPVIEGEDSENAPGVELGEEARIGERVIQNAGDEKAGENKKEIDPEESVVKDVTDHVDKETLDSGVGLKYMGENDHKDGHAAKTVQGSQVSSASVSQVREGGRGRRHGY
jgi:hypothetical protein